MQAMPPPFTAAACSIGTTTSSTWEAQGDLDHALADFTKAVELDPNDATDYFNRGTVYKDKGDLDRALADYNRVIALNPDDGGAYRKRGVVYEAKGDFARAQADYKQADRLELQALTKSGAPR